MADFKTKFVSATIAISSATATQDAPANFDIIQNLGQAFLIPATMGKPSAGIGRTSGSFNNSLINKTATATITDTDTITFNDGNTAQFGTNLAGVNLVEYIGPIGGGNEVKLIGVKTVTLTAVTTADSSAITGYTNINKVVPFMFTNGDLNSSEYRCHFGDVDIVTSGPDQVARVTRGNGTANMTAVIYLVEFVGANWTVQKVTHTFAASATNEDDTISSVGNVSNAFTYSCFRTTSSNVPAQQTYYAYLQSATTLRHWVQVKNATAQVARTWIMSNPQLVVTRYGTPDGVADLTAAGGNVIETQNVTITAVPSLTQAIAIGYAGSMDTGSANTGGATEWLLDLSTTTNARLRRENSLGNAEYVIQVVDFSAMQSNSVDSVTPITDGSAFTITGTFAAGTPTVTIGTTDGSVIQAQTVNSNNGTTIVCNTAAIGPLKYAQVYTLTVSISGVSDTLPVSISPSTSKRYVDLVAPLAPFAQRLTSTPDIAGGDQIEWSLVNGVAMGMDDVLVYPNAAFEATPAVTNFTYRVNDGTGWGTTAIQTIEAPAGGGIGGGGPPGGGGIPIPIWLTSDLFGSYVFKVAKVFEISPAGLVRWKDYIPVKTATDVNTTINSFNNLGGIAVQSLLSVTGLTAWVDYIPVVTVTDPDVDAWRTDNNGFIPVIYLP